MADRVTRPAVSYWLGGVLAIAALAAALLEKKTISGRDAKAIIEPIIRPERVTTRRASEAGVLTSAGKNLEASLHPVMMLTVAVHRPLDVSSKVRMITTYGGYS